MSKSSLPSDPVPLARRLRRDGTAAERRLWRYLRNRGLDGHKFRRQHPIGGFVADFACVEAKLVVEVDGGQHGGTEDARRTAALRRHGFTVLRFWNNDVLANTEGVVETIRAHLAAPPPP
ncbi:MAG: endonuclease domain-containing protein [Rhodospirillales bacterium]|nr:MAG: endonuclease domain-containing protein [Rhodospirillales bacterium]